jgi:hypothetical protein
VLALVRLDPALGLVNAWQAPADVTIGLLDDAAAMASEAAEQMNPRKPRQVSTAPTINAMDVLDKYMLRPPGTPVGGTVGE